VSFSYVRSHAINALNGNEVILDTSDAQLVFADGNPNGNLHLQFNAVHQLPYNFVGNIVPMWLYSVQPSGISVEGDLQVDFALPKYQGSYDYAPENDENVLLVGLEAKSNLVRVMGVGTVNNYRVKSIATTHFTVLDEIGYVRVPADQQQLLTNYITGDITLNELYIALQNN